MNIQYGKGKTDQGPGVEINLTDDEVALAILAYLVARDVHITGPRTVRVNDELCTRGQVYVDPAGSVVHGDVCLRGSRTWLEIK